MTAPVAGTDTPPDSPHGAPSAGGPSAPLSLTETRGASYPVPGQASPAEVTSYVWRLYNAQENDALFRYRTAAYNLLMADGQQALDWNVKDRLWRQRPLLPGQVQATINYIRPVLRSRAQRIGSAELRWKSTPTSNANEARDRSTVAEHFVAHRYEQQGMAAKRRTARWLADCTGVAFLKSFWDPSTGPLTPATLTLPHPRTGELTNYPITPPNQGAQPLVDPASGDPLPANDDAYQYRPGDTDTAIRTIFNLRVNPEAWGFTANEGFRWLIDAELTPVSVIKERYGTLAKDLGPGDLGQLQQYQLLLRALAGRPGSVLTGLTGGSANASDRSSAPDQEVALLMEYWEEPSELLPQGRLIVQASQQLLYDGPLPQGFVPYVPLYSERKPYDPYGHAIVAEMVSPQCIYNENWSILQQQLKRDAVGQWVTYGGTGIRDQLGNQDDAVLEIPLKSGLGNRSISDLLQRMPNVQISESRVKVMEMCRTAIFDVGAFHEIQRGQVPPGVDSGVAVQLLLEADDAQLGDTIQDEKATLLLWARQQLGIARWGYGPQEERWLPNPDPSKLYLTETVNGLDLPDPDTISLTLEGFKPTSPAANRAEIIDLATRQLIPGPLMVQLLDLGRGIDGLFPSQTRHYDRARIENLAFQKGDYRVIPAPAPGQAPPQPGEPPPVEAPAAIYPDGSPFLLPSEDDDAIHIQVHQDVALDNSQPWPVRQAVLLHIAEHRMNQQAKAADQMAAMQPPMAPNAPPSAGRPPMAVVR